MTSLKRKNRLPEVDFDAIVVGAGFAGLYMLYRLRNLGLSVQTLEIGTGVGGTWYWNRYPGARCDTESMFYSYQFSNELQQEWEWTERYPCQPEIPEYANHVADRFDLRRDIQFGVRVTDARWNEADRLWLVKTSDGGQKTARFCVMATGCLSTTNIPNFKGLGTFRGKIYHTGEWPDQRVDFTDKRVAVLGTGSSGIQVIPVIADNAKHLYVFQRTANYVVPAHNRPLEPKEVKNIKANYPALRAKAKSTYSGNIFETGGPSALLVSEEERLCEYETRWQMGGLCLMAAYEDLQSSKEANETAAQFVHAKIRDKVEEPLVAKILTPKNMFGCKRLCVGSGYYSTFNRNNVTLIDVSESSIDPISPEGVCVNGQVYEVDTIVLATGFDAMTGALKKINIRGKGNAALKEKWLNGPLAYLGLSIAGFPNLFTITGPGSPSVLTNMIPSIEQHVEWISDCISYTLSNDHSTIEAKSEAEEDWMEHVKEIAERSLRTTCLSWYLGSNVPGKPRIFMPYLGGFPAYWKKCEEVVSAGYSGFSLS